MPNLPTRGGWRFPLRWPPLLRFRRALARAIEPEEELPYVDPYVISRSFLETVGYETLSRSVHGDFTVEPGSPLTMTAAGPDFDDPPIVVTQEYPYG